MENYFIIFSKDKPRTNANLVKAEISLYSYGRVAWRIFEDFAISFHWGNLDFKLPTSPFNYGKLSYAKFKKSQPAAEKNEGSGLGLVAVRVVPLIK